VERTPPSISGRRVGAWLMIPDPIVVEIAARSGVDWVGLDLQHGAWDLGRAFRAIQLLDAIGVPALVRLSQDELALVPRVLDHGASGIVVAMVESAAVAAAAVAAARYAPEGRRSYGGQRYGLRPTPEPVDVSEVRPAIFAMIEDRRGLETVESIARVPGLAGLHIGPVDLGLGLGLGMSRSDQVLDQAMGRIRDAGHAAGLTVSLHAVRGPDAQRRYAEGFDEVVLPADVDLLRSAFAQQVQGSRGAADGSLPLPAYGLDPQ
jgi:4-hydroxy-2-oxoheptanedioate aldolase